MSKLAEWNKMSYEEKSQYNGYNGFVKGLKWSETSLFLKQSKKKQEIKSKKKLRSKK